MADGNAVELTERVAQAVVGVPGVAFLRPGLVGLLGASVMARMTDRAKAEGTFGIERARSAVRVRHENALGALAVEVSIVLRRGYRALDVAHDVSVTVQGVVPAPAGDAGRTRVTVTVTGLV